uniref:Putative malonyl-coa:acp transacylase n=1 Tax=Ixodes ricinus TaxID=34613 RepID=A0A0K8REK5_IXORI
MERPGMCLRASVRSLLLLKWPSLRPSPARTMFDRPCSWCTKSGALVLLTGNWASRHAPLDCGFEPMVHVTPQLFKWIDHHVFIRHRKMLLVD